MQYLSVCMYVGEENCRHSRNPWSSMMKNYWSFWRRGTLWWLGWETKRIWKRWWLYLFECSKTHIPMEIKNKPYIWKSRFMQGSNAGRESDKSHFWAYHQGFRHDIEYCDRKMIEERHLTRHVKNESWDDHVDMKRYQCEKMTVINRVKQGWVTERCDFLVKKIMVGKEVSLPFDLVYQTRFANIYMYFSFSFSFFIRHKNLYFWTLSV